MRVRFAEGLAYRGQHYASGCDGMTRMDLQGCASEAVALIILRQSKVGEAEEGLILDLRRTRRLGVKRLVSIRLQHWGVTAQPSQKAELT